MRVDTNLPIWLLSHDKAKCLLVFIQSKFQVLIATLLHVYILEANCTRLVKMEVHKHLIGLLRHSQEHNKEEVGGWQELSLRDFFTPRSHSYTVVV